MVLSSGAAFAGRVDLTTYYPAPYGEYQTLSATGNTYLATTSGNVGIGTTSPASTSKLVVVGPDTVPAGAMPQQILVASSDAPNNRLEIGYRYDGASVQYGRLQAWSTLGARPLVLNDGGGNVGIGTVNPNTALDVRGQFWIQDANNAAVIHFPSTGILPGLYLRSSDPSTFVWNTRLYISGVNGNIGIGTELPGAYKLHVAGTIYTSSGCTGCSDARWKTNIEPIAASLDKIMALTGVQFNWKTEEYPSMFFREGLDYGLVAQDVEKTLPEVVYEDNGYKYIRYDRLSALLIEATKEQQKEIDDLKNELRTQIKLLKKEIAELQK